MGVASSSHSCGAFPHDAPVPADGARYFKASSTGLLLFHRSWAPAGAPRATVYVVHGYGEHLGRHEPLARALAAAGFAVHALDLQGHGQSHGDRAFLTTLADVVADVLELAARVAPPDGPAFLFGHSMGGLVALRAAQAPAGAALFGGAVLCAPALKVDPAVDTALNRFLALSLSSLLPKLPVTPLDARKLCTDARVVDAYTRDPLVYHGAIRVRTGAEIIKGIDAAFADAAATAVPLLVVHGKEDAVCPVDGSRRLAAALPPPRAELREYAGSLHELFNEPAAAPLATADVIAWLDARVAAIAAAAAASDGSAGGGTAPLHI